MGHGWVRVLGLMAACGLLFAACEFGPEVPDPEGVDAIVASVWLGVDGDTTIELDANDASPGELEDIASGLADLLGSANPSGTRIDGPAIESMVTERGFNLEYLSWCAPSEQYPLEVQPPVVEPVGGCVILDMTTGFPSLTARLVGGRTSLVVVALVHILLMVAVVGTAVRDSRNDPASRLRPWWLIPASIWLSGIAAVVVIGITMLPSPSIVTAMEPGTGAGRLLDLAAVWSLYAFVLIGPVLFLAGLVAWVRFRLANR